MAEMKLNGLFPDNFKQFWTQNKSIYLNSSGPFTSTRIRDDLNGASSTHHSKILVHLHIAGDKMSIHPTTGHGVWTYDKNSQTSTTAIAYNFFEAADPDRWADPEAKTSPGFQLWHQLADSVVQVLLEKYEACKTLPHTEVKTAAFKMLRSELASGLYVFICTPMTIQAHRRDSKHPSFVAAAFLIGKEDKKMIHHLTTKVFNYLDTCSHCMGQEKGCKFDSDLHRCGCCVVDDMDCVVFRPITAGFDGASVNRSLPDLLESYGVGVNVDGSHGAKCFFNHLRNWGIQVDLLQSVLQWLPMLSALTVDEAAGSELLRAALGSGWGLLSADMMHHDVIQAFASGNFDRLYKALKYVVYVGAPAVTRFTSASQVPQRSEQLKALQGLQPMGWSLAGRGYLYWSDKELVRGMSHTNHRTAAMKEVRVDRISAPWSNADIDTVPVRVGFTEYKSNTGNPMSFMWDSNGTTRQMEGLAKDSVAVGKPGWVDDSGLRQIIQGLAMPYNVQSKPINKWQKLLWKSPSSDVLSPPTIHRMEAARSSFAPCWLDVYVLLSNGILLVWSTHAAHTGNNSTLDAGAGWVDHRGRCLAGSRDIMAPPGATKTLHALSEALDDDGLLTHFSGPLGPPLLGGWKLVATDVVDFDVATGALSVSTLAETKLLLEGHLFVDRPAIASQHGEALIDSIQGEQYTARRVAAEQREHANVPKYQWGGIHAAVPPGESGTVRSSQGGTLRADRVPWHDKLREMWKSATTLSKGWSALRSTLSGRMFMWSGRDGSASYVNYDLSTEFVTSSNSQRPPLGRGEAAFLGFPTLGANGLVDHGLLPHGGDAVCVNVCGCPECIRGAPPPGHPSGVSGLAAHLPSTLFSSTKGQGTAVPVLIVLQATESYSVVCRRVGDYLLASGEAKEAAGRGDGNTNTTIGGQASLYTASLAMAELVLGQENLAWSGVGTFSYEVDQGDAEDVPVGVRSFNPSLVAAMNLDPNYWKGQMRHRWKIKFGGRKAMFPKSLLNAMLGTVRMLAMVEKGMATGFVRTTGYPLLQRALSELQLLKFQRIEMCFAYLGSMLVEWFFGRIRALHPQPGTVAGSAVWVCRRTILEMARAFMSAVSDRITTQEPRRRSSKTYGTTHGCSWAHLPESAGQRAEIVLSMNIVLQKISSFAVAVGRSVDPMQLPDDVEEEEPEDDGEDEEIWDRTPSCELCQGGCNFCSLEVEEATLPTQPKQPTRSRVSGRQAIERVVAIKEVVEQLLRAMSGARQLVPGRWAMTKQTENRCDKAN
jgi:hypothetical protein